MVITTAEFKQFERNLEFARRLVGSGRQLEQSEAGSFEVADLYRAAWVQAVSVLDPWVTEGAAAELLRGEGLRAIALRRAQIVHEADLAENGRRPLRAEEVDGVIRQAEHFARAAMGPVESGEVPAVSGSGFLFTLGYRENACWLLRDGRAAFPNGDRGRVDRLVVGDELFLVTTQKCWGDGPGRAPTLVIGSAVLTSPVALLAEPPVLAGRRYPRACELRLTRLATYREGVDLKSLVPRLEAFPKGTDWGRPLRQTVTELSDADAALLRAELAEVGADPAVALGSYPGPMPEDREEAAAG
ncbi:MAG TPA: hypothetical protein VH008_07635 [Pseudonocardia sp.]|nr:hypothetical protein [Pseudonocardia sp.]